MASLRDLQLAFASAVVSGDASAIAPWIVAKGLDPARRVRIYANNVRENFLAALEASFPVLVRLAGPDWFRQTGRGYLRQHPSRCGNLHYVGERFAGYLDAELANGPYAYFADVARLEWAYQQVLIAAEPHALDLAALANVEPAQYAALVFELSSAARLIRSVYPLLAIWRANQPDADPSTTVRLDAGPSRLLVIRRDTHVDLRELAPGDFTFLDATASGATVDAATDAAAGADPDFNLAAALPRLMQAGALAGFHLRASAEQPR